MRTLEILVLVGLIACTPLEERVKLYGGWCASPRQANSACVVDGDTFDLAQCQGEGDPERVRMLGIDAPEVEDGTKPAECYSSEATDALTRIMSGRTMRLEFDLNCTGHYGRTLAWVFIEIDPDAPLPADIQGSEADHLVELLEERDDGSFELLVNEWMVRSGHAPFDERWEIGRYLERLREAQRQAMVTGQGLWGVCEES
jgi:micrococcal nuclease